MTLLYPFSGLMILLPAHAWPESIIDLNADDTGDPLSVDLLDSDILSLAPLFVFHKFEKLLDAVDWGLVYLQDPMRRADVLECRRSVRNTSDVDSRVLPWH